MHLFFLLGVLLGLGKDPQNRTDSASFLVIFTGYELDFSFFFLQCGAGCEYTNFFYADTRLAPRFTTKLKNTLASLSFSRHTPLDLSNRSPLILSPLSFSQAFFSTSPHLLFSYFTSHFHSRWCHSSSVSEH